MSLKVTILTMVIALIISFIMQLSFIYFFSVIVLCLLGYYAIDKIASKYKTRKVIDESFKIARTYLIDSSDIILLIIENQELLWANEEAFEQFSSLRKEQNVKKINLDLYSKESILNYQNKYYHVKKEEKLFVLRNITSQTKEMNSYIENKPNIGFFRIDNYRYLSTSLSNSEFIKFESELKRTLVNWFDDNDIFYNEIDEETYQFCLPTSVLNRLATSEFAEMLVLNETFNEKDIAFSFSLGVATNYTSIIENGNKAEEAMNLAITRGGGQICFFDDENKKYYGTGLNKIHGGARLKAKLMTNTLNNLVTKQDVVYLLTHQNPDSDAIASLFLMRQFIKERSSETQVKLIIDGNATDEIKELITKIDMTDVMFNTVVDKTKKNLLVVLDTQSTKFISHKILLKEIETKIVIDHHQTPVDYIKDAIFSWVEPSTSSTVELMCEIFNVYDISINDISLANLALLGVLTDTNNLKYRVDNNSIETISFLLRCGASISEQLEAQYLTKDLFKIKQMALSNVEFYANYSLVEVQGITDDIILSVIVNEQLKVKSIDAGVIVSKVEDYYKVKIRTNGNINAKILIEEYSGGGHKEQAAGNLSAANIEKLLNKIRNLKE